MEQFLSALASLAGILAFASLLAFTNERIVEQYVKPIMTRFGVESWVGQVAMATGTGIAFAFGLDLYAPLARAIGMNPPVPWSGVLLTGLVIGGGSNLLNDLWPTRTSTTTKQMTVTQTTSEPAAPAAEAPTVGDKFG